MSPASTVSSAPRIVGGAVPARFPEQGDVRVLCVGEAPGPRGADKSGVPFFGDRAGAPLYRALEAAGACVLPPGTWALPWDGAVFAREVLTPTLRGVALGNAYDRCPTDDGRRFRAPSRAELESPENVARLSADFDRAQARGLRVIVALGRVASRVCASVLGASVLDASVLHEARGATPARWPGVQLVTVPHPSAQGLLSAAPDRGRGARLADLAQAWEHDLVQILRRALEGA
jgi:uracil-DNA glycosylase